MKFRPQPALAFWLLFALSAVAEDRVALVIGNGAYDGAAALKNPPNDAEVVAAALTKLDFNVTKAIDLDLPQFEEAVVKFSRALKKDSVAFFFYAGHGVQVKGENFLVPLKANPQEEFQVKQKCYKVDHVLDAMDSSSAALKVVILDCCRDNPFTRGWTRGAANQGLASIAQIPDGTIIAFSTAPGKTALDGRGANSPHTKHLAAALNSRPAEGLELKEAIFDASRAVKKEIGQTPWVNLEASLERYYLWRSGDNSQPAIPPPKETASLPRNDSPPKPIAPDLMPQPERKKGPDLTESTFMNELGMAFRRIEAGNYRIGVEESAAIFPPSSALAPQPTEGRADERMAKVAISRPYYIGCTEVTQRQWHTVMGTKPWEGKSDAPENASGDRPATYVTWKDAVAFCEKLAGKERHEYRLPTEAEWEIACQGAFQDGVFAASGFEGLPPLEKRAFFRNADGGRDLPTAPQPVRTLQTNPLGLYDMQGNVAEWCQDYYAAKYPGGKDPVVTTGTHRICRGGSWNSVAFDCRPTARAGQRPDEPLVRGTIGFRVCISGFILVETDSSF